MWRLFSNRVFPVAIVCVLAGCQKEQRTNGPQIIYAGLGISNRLELGMTLREVEEKNARVHVRKDFPASMQWWQRPFLPVQGYEVTVAAAGARLYFAGNGQKLLLFRFDALGPRALPHSTIRHGTNELLFVPGQRTGRDNVVRVFGEPIHRATNSSQAQGFRMRGESVSEATAFSKAELLHYPAEGIMFLLNHSTVTEFVIEKKIPRTNPISTP